MLSIVKIKNNYCIESLMPIIDETIPDINANGNNMWLYSNMGFVMELELHYEQLTLFIKSKFLKLLRQSLRYDDRLIEGIRLSMNLKYSISFEKIQVKQ